MVWKEVHVPVVNGHPRWRAAHAACAVGTNLMYIFGGREVIQDGNQTVYLTDLEVYDRAAGTITGVDTRGPSFLLMPVIEFPLDSELLDRRTYNILGIATVFESGKKPTRCSFGDSACTQPWRPWPFEVSNFAYPSVCHRKLENSKTERGENSLKLC